MPQDDQQQVVTICNKTSSTSSSHVLHCPPIIASPDPSLDNLSVSLSLCHRRLLYVPPCSSEDRAEHGSAPCSQVTSTNKQHSNEADQSSDIGVFSLVLSPIMPTLTDCSLELLLSCGARLEVLSIIVRINTQMDPRHK